MSQLHSGADDSAKVSVNPVFTRAGEREAVPKYRLPEAPMLPETAYQIVHDEVMLDGNARFNLATFVTTWMDRGRRPLYAATFDKNMIDKDEYPQTAEIENAVRARCSPTSGTPPTPRRRDRARRPPARSEALHARRPGAEAPLAAARGAPPGKPTDKPNIVMGANVQVVWEKFANYWDVEPRYVPLEGDVFHLTRRPDARLRRREHDRRRRDPRARPMDGIYEPVSEICAALDALRADGRRLDVPVHVDAASGGFIAPFIQPRPASWDFRLERVVSIQTSGHKYGLVYPGVGWVAVARGAEYLPGGPRLPRELPRRRHADASR